MNRYSISTPRAKFVTEPFVNAYTDVEKKSAVFTIGNSDENEDIFGDNLPEYVRMRCKLLTKTIFPNVTISAGYRTVPNGQDLIMHKKLYDGSEIPMKDMVSEVDIEFLDFQSEFKITPNELFKEPIIYRKVFQIQNISKRIPNYPDSAHDQAQIFRTKSDAHPFAGTYFSGIKLSEIQPYLFYVGTGIKTEPYIKVISVKDALQKEIVKICSDIDVGSLSTLEDDICDEKVKFNVDDFTYASILAQKNTLTSDIFTILFKKIND